MPRKIKTKEEADQLREDFLIEFPAEEVALWRARKKQLEDGIEERRTEIMQLTKTQIFAQFPWLPKSYTKIQMAHSIAYCEINKQSELEIMKQQLHHFEEAKKLLAEYAANLECENCGNKIPIGEEHLIVTWNDIEKTLCEECDHDYFKCDKCGAEANVDEDGFEALPNGDSYCPKCWKEMKQQQLEKVSN